ncbi:uncharacterized protein LOC118431562 [Branchiostoma floridae]|uniref:Uncharacterized protein LOC118431562 n=1 Tax=Branchiostoma floridae TaxID=7739 RepID=A0A9J7MCF1_BRAFL|nr:uncharacterized protein LOC118431562 [Branchiostoma floridae]
MKLLVVAVFLSLAAYAASQNMINCFDCKTGTFDGAIGAITGNNPCLTDANNPNSTVQQITCPVTSQCFTKLETFLGFAHAIERGCWSDDDDTCAEEVDADCAGTSGTGTCLQCCNTDRCNANFAQRTGVLNGVTGVHQFSLLALVPVALAMFF